MEKCAGKSVFGGIAIGRILLFKKQEQQVRRQKVDNPELEEKRFEDARQEAMRQLGKLHEKALVNVGESGAEIFEVHQMMLEDDDYIDSVMNIISSQQMNAEYAVAVTSDNFAKMFESMDDDYMRGRAADVRDISNRVINILLGINQEEEDSDEPRIIVADDLAPSETVQFDKSKLLAFVTVHGSTNSHTAILARTMGIPALIGTPLALQDSLNGKLAVVDGDEGVFYIDPDEETLMKMQKKEEATKENQELLLQLKNQKTVTKDGREIMSYANIGNLKDLPLVLQNGGEGIGLFRSEFLYIGKDTFPGEQEQFEVYRTVAENMAGKEVVIRTLDIGADKKADYFELGAEENPAMGMRAIRICLTRPEIFKTQLRAIYRASAFGHISIMYPMITSLEEVAKAKQISSEVRKELTSLGVPIGKVKEGIMIETPAAVMISDLLAKEVDFFSIGTNDLTQYSLAIDRQNQNLDDFYNSHHTAVLRMIYKTVVNAHRAGIWCGICGELGADRSLTQLFMAMGVDELSVSPGSILPVRKAICETDLSDPAYRKKILSDWNLEELC